jgi:hypothetical protein
MGCRYFEHRRLGSFYVANYYFPYAAKKRRLIVVGQWVTMMLGQWVHDFLVNKQHSRDFHAFHHNFVSIIK